MRAAVAWALAVACTGAPTDSPTVPVSAVSPVPDAAGVPEIAWALPTREAVTPVPIAVTPELEAARARLRKVVEDNARDPANPWAVAHAMLVLGADFALTNGEPAVDWLFAEYAEEAPVGGEVLIGFPRKRGTIRIEPHTDLLLKSLAGAGIGPDRAVVVEGHPHEVGDLYRHSLSRTWVEGARVSADDWNDLPWTLEGLATWAPPGLSWTAEGHPMTMDGLTHAVVEKLAGDTAFIREALASGGTFEKRGQGIFAYTCGGAHLHQGTAYAVARGFGAPEDRDTLVAQIPGLFARVDVELGQVDALMRARPDYAIVLVVQRLKFLGHFLETTHKMAALGLFVPDEGQKATLDRVVLELIATVGVIEKMGLFDRMADVRKADEQIYLDLVGDSAHAVRGIDLATGQGAVRY